MPTPLPLAADTKAIAHAAGLLRAGGLVAFPTETVYGLGADARNPQAVQRIFTAKGRPADHPLIVHLPDKACLDAWATAIPAAALKLAAQFWPGPLALVLNKRPEVPLAVTGGQQTVALRVPNHPVALQLLQTFGGGVAAPSANRFCRISPTQAAHVAEELGAAVDLILDGGACQVGVESTIIDLSTDQPKLLRPGHITRAQIEAALGVELLATNLPQAAGDLRAPGMMALHYAPLTPTFRCATEVLATTVDGLTAVGKQVGVLGCRVNLPGQPGVTHIRLADDAAAYAQGLYAALRSLDRQRLDLILIEQPPTLEAWRAVNDRLGKAAAAYPTP